MYKVAIIEDEVLARDTLKMYLKRFFSELHVVAEVDNVNDAINYLSNNHVDVLFVDVQLKDGTALEILNRIDSSKYKLVFTTAFDNYAIDAFKHKTFGYLLKPIDVNDFTEIVSRVVKDLSISVTHSDQKLRVPISNGYKWINFSDIVRCESASNYTKVFTHSSDRVYIISRTLKSIESELNQSLDFIRVHQSHLINLCYVADFELYNNFLELKTGDRVPVSRRMRKDLFFKLGGK